MGGGANSAKQNWFGKHLIVVLGLEELQSK